MIAGQLLPKHAQEMVSAYRDANCPAFFHLCMVPVFCATMFPDWSSCDLALRQAS